MPKLQKPVKERYFLAFLFAFAAACACFVPYIIYGDGIFQFYGDYNVQQIPFYKMTHEMIRSGNIFWNWNTDLGANFVGSYSFYNLGSPFFWLTLPFPNEIVPYLMGPLFILKFSLASLTAYCYLRRFIKTPNYALIGGLLYAFSGFSIYNIFYNHFHEAIVLFPVLLLAMELFAVERKRGLFAAAVFLCALSNYFFFAGMVVFCLIYWVVRMLSGQWKMGSKDFLLLVLEACLGILLAGILLVPSYFAVIQNPRASNITLGWNALLYWKNQIFGNIIQCFFFPPDVPARAVFFPDASVQWSSLGGWLPVFGMCGVCAFFCARRGHWIKRIISVCAFMALVPILNSAFYMFNSAYYARWFYMPVLMMVLATVSTFEQTDINWKRGARISMFITAFIAVFIGFYPAKQNEDGSYVLGLYNHDMGYRFWINCAVAAVGLAVSWLLYSTRKKNPKLFTRLSVTAVICVSVIFTLYFNAMGQNSPDYTHNYVVPHLLKPEAMDLPGSENSRIDVYKGMDNTGMFLGFQSIQAFHSIVPQSVMEFYPYVGVERGVGSRPKVERGALRTLLSVKYLLDFEESDGEDEDFFIDEHDEPRIAGFEYYGTQNGHLIYENTNYIPYGFTYDHYITQETCDFYSDTQRSDLMLKGILLSDEQIEKYGGLLTELPENNIKFSDEDIAADASDRRSEVCSSFIRDRMGFTAEITLSKDNLVFFSVPSEPGWSATVDGSTAAIEQVNAGFMAVRVPKGTHTIRFNYMTPGLIAGCAVSGGALVAFIGYLLLVRRFRRRKAEEKELYAPVPPGTAFDVDDIGLPYDSAMNNAMDVGDAPDEYSHTAQEGIIDLPPPVPEKPAENPDKAFTPPEIGSYGDSKIVQPDPDIVQPDEGETPREPES